MVFIQPKSKICTYRYLYISIIYRYYTCSQIHISHFLYKSCVETATSSVHVEEELKPVSATYCICLYTRPSTSWICITMWGVGHFFWRRTWIVSFFCLYLWDGILFRVNNSLHRMLIDNLSLLDLTITWMNFVPISHLKVFNHCFKEVLLRTISFLCNLFLYFMRHDFTYWK
jgi:hypothetical protein